MCYANIIILCRIEVADMFNDYPGERFRKTVRLNHNCTFSSVKHNAEKVFIHQNYAKPLMAFGALASPSHLSARLPYPEGTLIVPAKMQGVLPVWGEGYRLTLANDSDNRKIWHDSWMIILPKIFNNARAIDSSEGRGYGFYDLVELDSSVTVKIDDIEICGPVTYLGGKFRLPIDRSHVLPLHSVITPKVLLTDLDSSYAEKKFVKQFVRN